MEELQHLRETILKDYPRLGKSDSFNFECGPQVQCFNHCCADVNIFLTPYDVLRMRKRLGIGSREFLDRYTLVPFDKSQKLPVPLFQMREDETKACQFVDQKTGCTIYEDRPWPCRIYPLGQASPGEGAEPGAEPFYFAMSEEFCKGHLSDHKWTVEEWLQDQGVEVYNEWGDLFKGVSVHPKLLDDVNLKPEQVDIYWRALYDLDEFREFIFKSTFLKRFEIDDDKIEALKTDDEVLLRFGFDFVRMALFGEKTIHVKDHAIKELRERRIAS
ncbi:YkgJ family cysteine cluster protein [Calditrichota bacterium]